MKREEYEMQIVGYGDSFDQVWIKREDERIFAGQILRSTVPVQWRADFKKTDGTFELLGYHPSKSAAENAIVEAFWGERNYEALPQEVKDSLAAAANQPTVTLERDRDVK